MPCSAAISSSRSPNAPLLTTRIFFPWRDRRRDRHLHRRRARAGEQQHLVLGRRAEDRPQLRLQAPDDRRVVLVAVADVVVHQRRLHARRGHDRARAEEHVARQILLGEQPLDQRQRVAGVRGRRGLHRRGARGRRRRRAAASRRAPSSRASRRPARAWSRRRARRPARARRRPPRPGSATARPGCRARRAASAT